MKQFPILYKRATTGAIQQWQIFVNGGEFYTISGQVEGKLTATKPTVVKIKNSGKKNATSIGEQAIKEAQSKHDFKLEHGYTLDITATDKTGYQEPMLAKHFEDYQDVVTYPLLVDEKLNGVRLNARINSLLSRRGKPFNTLPHIKTALAPIFEKYPELFLDGEAFNEKLKNHLNRLIEIVSVAYKPKDVTVELLKESEAIVEFHVYDGFGFHSDKYGDVVQATPFTIRRAALKELLKGVTYIHVLDTIECKNLEEVKALLEKSRKEHPEGIIIRWGNGGYEFKRSKYLLKWKNFMDAEFTIVDVEPGSGDWEGCSKRIILKLPKPTVGRDGKIQTTFASNIEGSMEYLRKMLLEKEKVIGKLATVRFQDYSEYKIPQIPYVEVIRDYE